MLSKTTMAVAAAVIFGSATMALAEDMQVDTYHDGGSKATKARSGEVPAYEKIWLKRAG